MRFSTLIAVSVGVVAGVCYAAWKPVQPVAALDQIIPVKTHTVKAEPKVEETILEMPAIRIVVSRPRHDKPVCKVGSWHPMEQGPVGRLVRTACL